MHMWRSEDDHLRSSGIKLRSSGLPGKCFFPLSHLLAFDIGSFSDPEANSLLCWPALCVFLLPVSSIHNSLLCGTLWPTDPSCGFNGVRHLELFFGQSGFFPHFSQVGANSQEAECLVITPPTGQLKPRPKDILDSDRLRL